MHFTASGDEFTYILAMTQRSKLTRKSAIHANRVDIQDKYKYLSYLQKRTNSMRIYKLAGCSPAPVAYVDKGMKMLERIEKITGVGLLHEVNGKPHQFHKATLIYADNGRGKSTLAAVLRAASQGAAEPIEERKTLDGTLEIAAKLNFTNGISAEFTQGKWTRTCPDLLVFDNAFIESNVHSGGTVSPDHRKNLLQFALGTAAVEARKKEVNATANAKKAADSVKQLTAELAGYHNGMTITAFEKLKRIDDAEICIAQLQKRLIIANSAAEVVRRPIPNEIELPPFDIPALFGILRLSIENIQEDAERLVRHHVEHSPSTGIEAWISSGQQFDDGEHCPYCAQNTAGLDLVKAYRTHFNAAYARLKSQVTQLRRGLDVRIGEQILSAFERNLEIALTQRLMWSRDVELVIPEFNLAACRDVLDKLNSILLGLIEKKEQNPTIAVGTEEELQSALNLWLAIGDMMRLTNEQIQACKKTIDIFKKSAAQEQPSIVQSQISLVNSTQRRFDPVVVDLFARLGENKLIEAGCNLVKKQAREELDVVMTKTLGTFEKSINNLLTKFGASFRIEKMDSNFLGKAPRTEYGIKLRGKSVPLEGGSPKFATALSDGDKRTLAFAFFVASSEADASIHTRIVVVDDPMCSLDINRKQHTKTVLKSLHAKADQLIVLAHDPFFIRDLRDALLPKDGQTHVQILQLSHAVDGYSVIAKYDVDHECESVFYRHHRMLKEFCEGIQADQRGVAKSLRPFLEGYLHRRFPRLIPADLMFGQAINFIKEADANSPVSFAQHLVDELKDLNDYAGQFHHDTNPDTSETIQVVQAELRAFCDRALHVVYSGRTTP